MLPARPRPVTRPMRALIDCTATISGQVSTTVHKQVETALGAGLRIGGDAARIVVRRARDHAGSQPLEQTFEAQAAAKAGLRDTHCVERNGLGPS